MGWSGLLLDADRPAVLAELDHAVALGIAHAVGEDSRALLACRGRLEVVRETVAIENIVAEGERHAVAADELATDEKGLGEASRMRLDGVGDPDAEGRPVPQQAFEARHVVRRRDEQDVADAGEHEARQRVVDHRLVVDRQQLLRDGPGDRVEPRTGASGENDAFHRALSISGVPGGDRTPPARRPPPNARAPDKIAP